MATTKFDPRRAEPGQEFTWHNSAGEAITAKADDHGIVRPKNDDQRQLADAFDLPVARKVAAEEKAAATETTDTDNAAPADGEKGA